MKEVGVAKGVEGRSVDGMEGGSLADIELLREWNQLSHVAQNRKHTRVVVQSTDSQASSSGFYILHSLTEFPYRFDQPRYSWWLGTGLCGYGDENLAQWVGYEPQNAL